MEGEIRIEQHPNPDVEFSASGEEQWSLNVLLENNYFRRAAKIADLDSLAIITWDRINRFGVVVANGIVNMIIRGIPRIVFLISRS